MNILYLSHLSGASYAGPTYSVPNQIEAQSKYDNVFWYNAVKNDIVEWKGKSFYHDLNEYPLESISSLPKPFNHPDLIVVELFYNMVRSNFMNELLRMKIPYIIIPRGELTEKAQKRKSFKKQIANLLVCRRYAKKAAAIQYLTEQEYRDSGDKWNSKHLVIPNGIHMPSKIKDNFSIDRIKCVLVGRIEPYQKGIDLLLEACLKIKDELRLAKVTIDIYGPDVDGKKNGLEKFVLDNDMNDIVSFNNAVYGEKKEKVLLEHDVFLIPSRFEGHPMALIEAMSYGIPCIASEGSNMKKEVEAYDAGWGFENSVESAIEALYNLIRNKSEISSKRDNAVILSKNYEWNTIAEKSHCEYLKILYK